MLDAAIRAGDLDVAVGGGMESMSNAPYLLPKARFGFRMGDVKALDAMIQDGLRNPFSGKQMFEEATEVGDELEMTRAGPRPLGAALARARDRGDRRRPPARGDRLGHGVRPEGRHDRRGRRGAAPRRLARAPREAAGPERPRRARTPPATRPGVNDGAGALVLASEDWAEANAKEVLGTIIAQAQVADDFAYLARTPANAAKLALDKAGLQPGDIDLWEINEAFASVTLNSIRMLGIDEDRVNVNGGAVAIGHPIGASGARILATLVHELRRRGGGYGCAAICSGGGQGDAVIIKV